MNQNLILNSIINYNNIICELLLRDEEMENELLINIIPKERKHFNSLFSSSVIKASSSVEENENFFDMLTPGVLTQHWSGPVLTPDAASNASSETSHTQNT